MNRQAAFLHPLTAIALALAAPLVLAQPGGARALERMDINGDGNLTREEAQQGRAQWFDRLDANGDGQLTVEEREAAREQARSQLRERANAGGLGGMKSANGDGTLTREAWMARPMEWFDRADTDGNGVVTAEERDALREQARALREQRTSP